MTAANLDGKDLETQVLEAVEHCIAVDSPSLSSLVVLLEQIRRSENPEDYGPDRQGTMDILQWNQVEMAKQFNKKVDELLLKLQEKIDQQNSGCLK